jgi:hypothetical protein
MSLTDEEARALRGKLEEAQAELAKAQEALMTAQLEAKRLEEEVAFARWAAESGESQGLKTALARSRAECESLRKELSRQGGLPRPKGPLQVVLMRTTEQVSSGRNGNVDVEVYVGFVVDRDRSSRDVVRSRNLEAARAEVERTAQELDVPVEDLT